MSPGPWTRSAKDGRLILDRDGNEVAMVIGNELATNSNALLIQAAPEMRDALRAVNFAYGEDSNPVMRRVVVVLGKAGAL
jgi:hypothetical protein